MAVQGMGVGEAADWLQRGGRLRPRCTAAVVVAGVAASAAVDILLGPVHALALLWTAPVAIAAFVGQGVLAGTAATVAVIVGAAAPATVAPTVQVGVRGIGLTGVLAGAAWAGRVAQELSRRSRTDGPTGVLNRSGFLVEVHRERERAVRTGAPLGLVYLDLDGLKQANDRHGHAYGDALLVRFAAHLHGTRRVVDVAARLGGDEFALLLPGADADGVAQVLDRLFAAVDADGRCLPVSAGAVTWAHPPVVARMVAEADAAMYRSKHHGGRGWVLIEDPSNPSADAGRVPSSQQAS